MAQVHELIAAKAIELLNKQVEQGIDEKGNKYRYSTKPFAMPSGALKIKARKQAIKDSKLSAFNTTSGALWYVVNGGYKSLREMRGQNPEGDFLQVTGRMLGALSTLRATDNEIAIGFTDAKQAQKAFWLTVSGAGKSRALWRFMGLTKDNQEALAKYAAEVIGTNPNIVFPNYKD